METSLLWTSRNDNIWVKEIFFTLYFILNELSGRELILCGQQLIFLSLSVAYDGFLVQDFLKSEIMNADQILKSFINVRQ